MKKKLEKKRTIYQIIIAEILWITPGDSNYFIISSKLYVTVISYCVPIILLLICLFSVMKFYKIQKEINSLKNEDTEIEESNTDNKKSYKKTILLGIVLIIGMFSFAIGFHYLYNLLISSIA